MRCENAEHHEGRFLCAAMATRDSEDEIAAKRVCGGELRTLGGLIQKDLIEQDRKVSSLAHISAVGVDVPWIGEASLQGRQANPECDTDPSEQHHSKLRHRPSPPEAVPSRLANAWSAPQSF